MTPAPAQPRPEARHNATMTFVSEAVATGDWKAAARAMAPTHTRREAADALGVPYHTLKGWARREAVAFRPHHVPAEVEEDEPGLAEMDDTFRLSLLGRLYRAQLGVVPADRLYRLTARPEPVRDVAAALARLVAA